MKHDKNNKLFITKYIFVKNRDFLFGYSLKEFPHKLSLNYLIFKELRSLREDEESN